MAVLLLGVAPIALPAAAWAQNDVAAAGRPTPAPTPTPTPALTAVPTTLPTINPGAATVTVPADNIGSTTPIADSGTALIKLFVLAVLLESALALLFNWRPFIAVFDGRGVKSLISLAAALVVTLTFRPDAFYDLLKSYGSNNLGEDTRWVARILEAMVIAGGSAGVNTMLVALGFRSARSETVVVKPAKTEAWISVGLVRQSAVGPVQVEICNISTGTANWQVCGTIAGKTRRRGAAVFFLRDMARFPTAGGWSLLPGANYKIRLVGQDSAGAVIQSASEWGPVAFAAGAVVDIELAL